MISPASSVARVREIRPDEPLKPFIDVAWTFNQHDPNWVPPLRSVIATVLDRSRHPFHQHAEVAYFLARRDDAIVGRVAAIHNRTHNDLHQDRVGFFGFFECEDDETTARSLLDAAAVWLRTRGLDTMRGPMNFSTNEEATSPGVLIEGFDDPPLIQMSHNPPYYSTLMESAGLHKAKDLIAFWLEGARPHERAARAFERMLQRHNFKLRPMNMKRFEEEIEVLKEIYNAAWSLNWGFVPMSDAEFDHMAREFKPIADPDLCQIAEVGGQPVGFALALPNFNEVLKHLPNGKLFPLGILKLLWYRRKISSARVITLGFKPGYQHLGLGAAFYFRTWQAAADKGYPKGECSWVLEDNYEMVRALERMGGQGYKRYRIYDLAL